jgi:hypothetical protein
MGGLSERSLISESCPYCKKPVYADEGYHSVALAHYTCVERADTSLKRLTSAVSPKQRRRRTGEGELSTKMKAVVTEFLKKEFPDREVTNILVWAQEGGYRGYKWDLAKWGMNVTLTPNFPVLFHSWDSMTECYKKHRQGKLTISSEGVCDYSLG